MKKRAGLGVGLILLGVTLPVPRGETRDFAPAQKWVARYNGPDNGDDRAWAMAVDKSGNVYVTGESAGKGTDYDYATIKYSPAGKRLWVQRYYADSSGYGDKAHGIAVDGSGNAYVTGETGTSHGSRITTIKYGESGQQIWVRRYNERSDELGAGHAIAVDGSGNVFVAGGSGEIGPFSAVIIKYNTNGKQLWAKRYSGPGNAYAYLTEIAVAGSGDVYAAGETDHDCVVIKYDSNGKQLWVKRYNGPGNSHDRAKAMVVDKSGNVYITGESKGSNLDFDYATIKYSPAGQKLWVQRYDGPGSDDDEATAIAVDGSGNVTITGKSTDSATGYDMATIKYSADGRQLWVQRYDGPGSEDDEATAIAADGSGNVYITGHSEHRVSTSIYSDYLTTVKYGSNGKLIWAKKYGWPGGAYEYAAAIVVDKSGNAYVTGESRRSGNWDYFTIKY